MFDWLWYPVKDSKPYWLEILTPTITILLAAVGYWWAFKVWKKQKSIETQIWAGQQKETARIAACKAAWSLLAYMSEKENSKTVFVVRGTKDHKTWHLRSEQGQEYINALEKVFFTDGHGVFLTAEIRDDLYQFRSLTYPIIEKEKRKTENLPALITLEEPKIIDAITTLRAKLNERLRAEIKTGSFLQID